MSLSEQTLFGEYNKVAIMSSNKAYRETRKYMRKTI